MQPYIVLLAYVVAFFTFNKIEEHFTAFTLSICITLKIVFFIIGWFLLVVFYVNCLYILDILFQLGCGAVINLITNKDHAAECKGKMTKVC